MQNKHLKIHDGRELSLAVTSASNRSGHLKKAYYEDRILNTKHFINISILLVFPRVNFTRPGNLNPPDNLGTCE